MASTVMAVGSGNCVGGGSGGGLRGRGGEPRFLSHAYKCFSRSSPKRRNAETRLRTSA